eukprot:m.631126 g.631126  ORF g.631126 m.631126 type:complete len:175 (+) comp58283_c0_seq21:1316-1840(+)
MLFFPSCFFCPPFSTAHTGSHSQEGEMKVYRRESKDPSDVCDRLKAFHSITGISAKEMCEYFYDLDVKLKWDHSLDSVRALEHLDADTLTMHLVFKRVWPSAQRETCFLSHRNHADNISYVTNVTVDDPKCPVPVRVCLPVHRFSLSLFFVFVGLSLSLSVCLFVFASLQTRDF